MAVCEQTPDDQFTARQAATLSTLLSLSGEKPTGTEISIRQRLAKN